MTKIYGVSFKDGGKIYFFNGVDLICPINTTVIVETEKGLQFGKVLSEIENIDSKLDPNRMKSVLRITTDADIEQYQKNLRDNDKALKKARDLVEELKLDMKLLDASFTFDRKQLLFNFLADERVDFRELAKKLAGIYRTRIELRQIGARDKAKEVGGIGQCGKILCCASYLNHMDSISMNMAKNQNLSLNPTKINGLCGRLLCCLTYEDDEYSRCRKGMPYVGEKINSKNGFGTVVSVDILNRKYKIDIDGDVNEVALEPCCENSKK